MVMPVVDGAALLAAMSARPDLASVPVVVMSSLPEATIAERCLGYAAILRKPFGIGEVLRLLVLLPPKGLTGPRRFAR